jgi:hypothetical protein
MGFFKDLSFAAMYLSSTVAASPLQVPLTPILSSSLTCWQTRASHRWHRLQRLYSSRRQSRWMVCSRAVDNSFHLRTVREWRRGRRRIYTISNFGDECSPKSAGAALGQLDYRRRFCADCCCWLEHRSNPNRVLGFRFARWRPICYGSTIALPCHCSWMGENSWLESLARFARR